MVGRSDGGNLVVFVPGSVSAGCATTAASCPAAASLACVALRERYIKILRKPNKRTFWILDNRSKIKLRVITDSYMIRYIWVADVYVQLMAFRKRKIGPSGAKGSKHNVQILHWPCLMIGALPNLSVVTSVSQNMSKCITKPVGF